MFEKLGGRKFVGFTLLILAGIAIEVWGKQGLTTTMAGYLVGMYTAFSAANAVVTKMYAGSEGAVEAPPTPVVVDPTPALNEIAQRQAVAEQALLTMQQSATSSQKLLAAIVARIGIN
jgi:hypothetical protein